MTPNLSLIDPAFVGVVGTPATFPAMPLTCTGFTAEYDPSGSDGYLRSCKVQAPADGNVTHLSCNLQTADGTVILGLYSDNSNLPDILLGNTASTTVVAGVNTVEMISPVSVTNGTDVWVSIITTGGSAGKPYLLITHGNPAGTNRYKTHTYANPLPNPYGTSYSHTTGVQLCISGS